MKPRGRVVLTLALVVVLGGGYALLDVLQRDLDRARQGLLVGAETGPRERLIELGTTVMLGSFRAVAVDLLWLRAGRLKERREWPELDGVIRLIAVFQPTNVKAYTFQIWNMAYNVQYDATTVVEAWRWVRKAIELGDEGAGRNPRHPQQWEIYWQIGWVFSHRCARVSDERTQYFAEQVRKEYGQHPYLVAARYYRKALDAAVRAGEQTLFVANRTANLAYAYHGMAGVAEEQGDVEAMIRWREKAIGAHEEVAAKFPAYQEHGVQQAARLRELIALHREEQGAARLTRAGKLEEEAEVRLRIAGRWKALFDQEPDPPEHVRGLDRSADALKGLAARVESGARRAELLRREVELRFAAARFQRYSPEAAERLAKALAPYDRRLAQAPLPELVRESDLVQLVADAHVRLLENFPRSQEHAKAAEAALRRDDRVLRELPPRQARARVGTLLEHWRTLLRSTDLDVPLARAALRQAAVSHEAIVLAICERIHALLEPLRDPSVPPAARSRAAWEVLALLGRAHPQAIRTTDYWRTLLRKDEPYAEDAPVAEEHLRRIALTIDETLELVHETLGEFRVHATARAGPALHALTRTTWRHLHMYDPSNDFYTEQAKGPSRAHAGHEH